MRRTVLFLAAATAASLLSVASPAQANPYCEPVGPVPGFGPVCTVKCALKTQVETKPATVTFDSCWWED